MRNSQTYIPLNELPNRSRQVVQSDFNPKYGTESKKTKKDKHMPPPVKELRAPAPGGKEIASPVIAAQNAIEEKHNTLGGDAGLLGVAVEDMKRCPDAVGYFRRYKNGMIYWTQTTNAHEIHGAVLAKWSSLGFERSLLGYPLTDESPTPHGVGRFNHFQCGSI